MSRQQLMNLYQRQVALGGLRSGGMATGGSGGLFTPESKAGLAEYRAWHAEYKMAHPGASRDDLKAAWRMHKSGMHMGQGALVGGRRRPKARMGSALVGGAKMSKGVRHCMEEVLEPSGVRRCAKYMPGPRSSMGSALVGGFPGQRKLFAEWRRTNRCSPQSMKDAFASARAAYSHAAPGDANFRQGVLAAEQALGLPAGSISLKGLRAPRARGRRAAAPAAAPIEAALEAKHEAAEAQMEANQAAQQAAAVEAEAARDLGISDADLEALLEEMELPAGSGRVRMGRRR